MVGDDAPQARTFVGPEGDPDKYEFVELRSRGGEGEVWKAAILIDNVHFLVAIKRILPANEKDFDVWHDRWQRQAELLRSLDHPGVVKIREVFTGPEPHEWRQSDQSTRTLYLAMNWVEGPTLAEWVNRNPQRDALDVMRHVGSISAAVDYLHAGTSTGQPVLHRDIKPANVIVAEDGAKLVDFGFVRGLAGVDPMTMVGTPDYIAPEVAAGLGFSEASDRFALGSTTFFALTGQKPRHEDAAWNLSQLDAVNGIEGNQALHDHILSMMAVDPADRPISAIDWAQGLAGMSLTGTQTHVRSSFTAPPGPGPSTAGPDEPPPRRSRRGVVAAALALLLVAAAGVGALFILSGDDGDGDSDETVATVDGDDVEAPAVEPQPSVESADEPASTASPEPEATATPTAEPTAEPEPTATEVPALVDVPAVTGSTAADADAALTQAGLAVEVVEEPIAGDPGRVLSQDPAGGTELAPGEPVTITVSAAVETPDLTGLTAAEARSQLTALGADVTEERSYSPDATTGEVLSQSADPGSPLPAELTIQVGQGPGGIFLEEFSTVDSEQISSSWQFGNGDINGETYLHTLRMSLRGDRTSSSLWMEWNLSRDFDRLRTVAGYNDVSSGEHRIRLQIYGDGVKLHESDYTLGDELPLEIDVSNVLRLRIEAARISDRSGSRSVSLLLGEIELLASPDVIERYAADGD